VRPWPSPPPLLAIRLTVEYRASERFLSHLVPDPRTDGGVQEIGDQVGEDDTEDDDDRDRLHQRNVAAVDGEQEQTPEPGVVEHVFDHDDPPDQPAEADRDHGDRRQQGVAQHVLEHDRPAGEPLQHGRPHVRATHLLDDLGAGQPGDVGEQDERRGQRFREPFPRDLGAAVFRVTCYTYFMAKVVSLVDGFNVYHALDQRSRHGGYPYKEFKWINYWRLSQCFVPQKDVMDQVRWFTAESPLPGREGDLRRGRHRRLQRANEAQGVQVVDGYFRPVTRSRKLIVPPGFIKYETHEEKRTDVAIAVALVSLAHQKAYDKAVLITADSDMIPAVEEAKAVHPGGEIVNVVPIERRARALYNCVDQQIRMRTKHLRASRLPLRIALDTSRTIRCPREWEYDAEAPP
jgi:uncharacterized LabA/DUF88 family protein